MREFEMHGSRFTSHVAPSTGSRQLCAWQLDVPAGSTGVSHQVTHEEVLLCLAGDLTVTVGDRVHGPAVGEPVFVPAGATVRVDAGPRGASAWVVAAAGLRAVTADGATITPPWTQ